MEITKQDISTEESGHTDGMNQHNGVNIFLKNLVLYKIKTNELKLKINT